jgi:hypothetical protein
MQPAMATPSAASHNSGWRSSGKRNFPLAAKVARELGLVPTWPNLQTIRLAIESEAALSNAARAQAAEMLIRAGKEWSPGPRYSCPSEWERRELFRLNTVDRFWFEDARWRSKSAYLEFRDKHGEQIA